MEEGKIVGRKKCDQPSHGNHMHHFEEALDDALGQWGSGDPTDMSVTFEIVISPNPGGVKEYIVNIGGGG
jgi:hypothetical protein